MIDTLLSVKTQLNPNRRKNVFEFLGYDFLIDEDFRVWLIEVNTNPYIGIPNAFIGKPTLRSIINHRRSASKDARRLASADCGPCVSSQDSPRK